MKTARRWLRLAFLAGAMADAVALAAMLWPKLARFLFGTESFGTWYGAALMLGWTLLLVWAAFKPLARRAVAPLTIVVILGIGVAGVREAVAAGGEVFRLMPAGALLSLLLVVFVGAYVGAVRETKSRGPT